MALLRYPGGKTRLIKNILPILAPMIGPYQYVEPYTGGGSVALKIATMYPEKKIILNDGDPDVANLWAVVSGQAGEPAFRALCQHVERSKEPTDDSARRLDYWNIIRNSNPEEPAKRAFRYLFLNKTCFGGQIDQSPMGGWRQRGWRGRGNRGLACQYTVSRILLELHKAHDLLKGRTRVKNVDGLRLLMSLTPPFAGYIDPPYFPGQQNRLYRCGMTARQHVALAAFLQECPSSWLLSYDDSEAVRVLYQWAWIFPLAAKYSQGPRKTKWKSKTELLIARAPIQARV